jgi:hypothetical protein
MLSRQKKRKFKTNFSQSPHEDPTSIGNLIVDHGILNRKDFSRLLEIFKSKEDKLLGQFIMEHTNMTKEQLEYLLLKQKTMRRRIGHSDIEHADIMNALKIAESAQDNYSIQIDKLLITMAKFNKV